MRTVFALVLLVLLTGESQGEDVKERIGAIPRMKEELKKVKTEYTDLAAKVENLILQTEENRDTITQLQTQAEDDRATITQLQTQVDNLLESTDMSAKCHLTKDQLHAFDGKSVSDFPLTTHGGLEKPWMCTRKCNEDSRCISYRYNSETGVCSTYAVGYSTTDKTANSVSMETGSKLYLLCGKAGAFGTSCTSTADCKFSWSRCKDGVCNCTVTKIYDADTGDCVSAFPECERDSDCYSLTNAHCYYRICRCDNGFSIDGTSCRKLTECRKFSDVMSAGYKGNAISGYNLAKASGKTAESCKKLCIDNPTCRTADFNVKTFYCFPSDKTWFEVSSSKRLKGTDYTLYQRDCDW